MTMQMVGGPDGVPEGVPDAVPDGVPDPVSLLGSASTRLRSARSPWSSELPALDSLADLAIQVTTAHSNYHAALRTTANIRQASLLEFLH